jgi:hypothetical protein
VKNLIAFIFGLLIIALGAGAMIFQQKNRADEAEFEQRLAEIHQDTARQVAMLTHSPEDKVGYDRQQVVRKHGQAIEELRAKYPEKLAPDAFIKNMEEKAKEGVKDKAKTAEYRARYDFLKEIWDGYMKNGNFKPLFAGESNGFRFEVIGIQKSNDGGEPGLRWDVLIYGAPPREQWDLATFNNDTWVEFAEKETSGKRKGQPKRVRYSSPSPRFMPTVLIDKPWEWFPEWPAGVMVGYYVRIPQWDSRSTWTDMSLKGSMRTVGGTVIPLSFEWKRLVIDASWKGTAGGPADNAGLVPLSDEDLKDQGIVLPEEEDEAAKKAAAGK